MPKPAIRTLALAAVLLVVLSACAPGSGDSAHAASAGGLSAFLLGVWHGIIGPVTLIGEIIDALAPKLLPWHVHLYETKASGVAYDIGFYLGLASHPFGWSRWRRR